MVTASPEERGVLGSMDVALGVLLWRRSVTRCREVQGEEGRRNNAVRGGGGGGVNISLQSSARNSKASARAARHEYL
jgi:hypothetical protein